ncbi:MAG: drug/metabolite transporter (DMT)-like permease [Paraglaciecola sp.]|jgi:drug/metabolite transporter (DMT)-like permease
MTRKITPMTALMLTVPPLLWASNAVIGRLIHEWVPPMTLNLLRWSLALIILLPLGGWVLRRGSGLWLHWRHFALLGLLGVGLYNSLQYLALQSSTPINVTLVASSMPVWMLVIGRLFFQTRIAIRQMVGAGLSIVGVLLVLSRGDLSQILAMQWVVGDLYMIAATIVWSFYSWMLTQPGVPIAIRSNWAAFLLAQVTFGVFWSSAFSSGEWLITKPQIIWSWPLAGALIFVSLGPAIIAFRCWGAGVQKAGPTVAGFFSNLTPLFAALISTVFLGEMPHFYHLLAFFLIIGGIIVSSRH